MGRRSGFCTSTIAYERGSPKYPPFDDLWPVVGSAGVNAPASARKARDNASTNSGSSEDPDTGRRHLELQMAAREAELVALERRLTEVTDRLGAERDQL